MGSEPQQGEEVLITIKRDKVALGPPQQDIIALMAQSDNDLSVLPP